jgi:hypothetical protein
MDHPWRKLEDLFNGKDKLRRAPRRRSGKEIDELLKILEECPCAGKETTEGEATTRCIEGEVYFLGPDVLEFLHT